MATIKRFTVPIFAALLIGALPYLSFGQEEPSNMNLGNIRNGQAVVPFSFHSLDDSTIAYSDSSMRGTVYLIDFWATWCVPCIKEMPFLHAAYERFKDKGFTILSLSFNETPEAVRTFRYGKFKMPWLHAWVEDTYLSPTAQDFGVPSLPRAILVNREGVVIAQEEEIRGENLAKVLDRVLKK